MSLSPCVLRAESSEQPPDFQIDGFPKNRLTSQTAGIPVEVGLMVAETEINLNPLGT